MKKFIIIIFGIIYFPAVSQSNLLIFKEKSFSIDNVLPENTSYKYIARDYIELLPGFEFTAQENVSFEAYIDPSLILPTNYNQDPVTWSDEYAVGSLPGQVDVSAMGGATYQIPIDVPPGTAGMQPNLSITYNSQSAGGILGVGWDIAGFSAISRVPSNTYYDGEIDPVDFDNNDRFILDGQRLIAVNGVYGADGTEYRTEIESFSRIFSYGNSGNGPLKFKVITKNGAQLFYAYNEDSRIQSTHPNKLDVNYWLLNKIVDANGNYMTITYLENDGYFYPKEIKYTGNSDQQPYNSVKFFYSIKTDINDLYIGGGVIKNKYLLRKIKIFNKQNKIKDYVFRYQFDHFSKLSEIILVNKDDEIINSTKISWNTSFTNANPAQQYIGIVSYKDYTTTGDFYGHGAIDYVAAVNHGTILHYDYEIKVYSWKDESFKCKGYDRKVLGIKKGDFDGDGKDELILVQNNNDKANHFYIINNIDKETDSWTKTKIHSDGYDKFLKSGEFNGDGLNDFLYVNNNKIHVLYNKGNNSFEELIFDKISLLKKLRIADFNGDGIDDIFTVSNNFNNDVRVFDVSKKNENKIYSSNIFDHKTDFYLADFNGDGKADVYTSGRIYFSTGEQNNNLLKKVFPGTITAQTDSTYIFVNDFTGDGKAECMRLDIQQNGNIDFCCFSLINNWLEIIFSGTLNSDFKFDRTYLTNFTDFNGDGKADIWAWKNTGGIKKGYIITFSSNKNHYIVKKITDGFNNSVSFDYLPLTNEEIYIKDDYSNDDVLRITPALYVVQKMTSDYNHSGTYVNTFYYKNLLLHKHGKGILGFLSIEKNNLQTNEKIVTENSYNSNYFYSYPLKTETFIGSEKISSTTNTYSHKQYSNKRFLPFLDFSTSTNFLNDITVTTDNTVDNYGNILSSTTDNGTTQTIVTNTYTDNNTGIDYLLLSQTTTKKRDNEPDYIRNIEYEYYSNGNLKKQISDKGTDFEIEKELFYNNFGLPYKTILKPANLNNRTSYIEYDDKGRFITKKINPLGFDVKYTYDNWGNILSETSINGLTTTYEYNNWGKLIKTIYPDGNYKTYDLNWHNSDYLYCNTVTNIDGTQNKVYSDFLQRESFFITKSFNGQNIVSAKEYNEKGQLIVEVLPHIENYDFSTINYTYDDYGRVLTINNSATGSSTDYNYEPKKTEIVTDGKSKETEINSAGEVIKSNDAGGTINYSYYASGLTKNISYDGNTVHLQYDLVGNKILLQDPDAGTIEYSYDALGNLTQQIDNGQDVFNMTYDLIGRLKTKTGPEGITTYFYDSQPNGKGKIASVTGFNGITQTYYYDNLCRNYKTTENIDSENYSYTYTYDNLGRVNTVKYPGGFKISKNYNNFGYLTEIRNTDNNQLLWQLNDMNQFGQITQTTLGNGLTTNYTFDTENNTLTDIVTSNNIQNYHYTFEPQTGNLQNRNLNGLYEKFEYDNLDRLTSVKDNNNSTVMQMYYNYTSTPNNGNILYKTYLGYLQYNDPNHPHAVTNVDNPFDIIPNIPQNINYTSFNKVSTITEGDYELNFTYNSKYERKKTELYENNNLIKTKYFFGAYEKEITPEGTRELNYITSPDGVVAIYERHSEGTNRHSERSEESLYYIHKDHLGSITQITNETGNLVQECYYNAWGVRELLQDNTGTGEYFLDRGYTGHEHLNYNSSSSEVEMLNLINMNGRVYDPILARFLSPDNYIQLPDFTQSFNRYSYVMNNPLKYTDPSGEIAWLIPVGIGMAYGAYMGYQAGKTAGASGEQMAAYIGGGAAIGGLAGFAGWGVGALGGAPWIAAGASGAINSGGFTALSGGSGGDIAFSTISGGLSGLGGGAVGSLIGGVPGVFIGSMANYNINWTMNAAYNGLQHKDIQPYSLKQQLFSAGVSTGMYIGSSYYNWRFNMNKSWNGHRVKFKSYLKLTGDFQRSRIWKNEYGGALMPDGSITRSKNSLRHNYAVEIDVPENAVATWHTHWDKGGKQVFVDINYDKIDATDIFAEGYQTFETIYENGEFDIQNANNIGKPSFVINRKGYSYYDLNNNYQINGNYFTRIMFLW